MNGLRPGPRQLPLIRGELAQLLSAVAENIKVQLEATVSGVNSLTVPDQMSAAHERLEVFFSRVSAIFGQAKTLSESGDPGAAQQEILGVGLSFCEARQGFESG